MGTYWIAVLAAAFAIAGFVPCGVETGGLPSLAAGVMAIALAQSSAVQFARGPALRWLAATITGSVLALPLALITGILTAMVLSVFGGAGVVGMVAAFLAIGLGIVVAGAALGGAQSIATHGRPMWHWVRATALGSFALAPFAALSVYGIAGSCSLAIPLPVIGALSGAAFGVVTLSPFQRLIVSRR